LALEILHQGFSDSLTAKGLETILQFKPDFWGKHFLSLPEMKMLVALLECAKKGVMFKSETKKKVGPKIQEPINYEGF